MKITIFGSTGFVGKVLIRKAIASGYQVKTLARHPEKLKEIKDKIEIIEGSVFESSLVEVALEGAEAVLSTVGPSQTVKQFDPYQYEKALKEIVRKMDKNGIKRYIHIGGAAQSIGDDEVWNFSRKFLRFFLNLFGKQILVTKQLEWEVPYLQSSDAFI